MNLHDIDRDRRMPLFASPKGILSLRWSAMVIVVVGWNALFFLARWLNGGGGSFQNVHALLVVAVATLGLAFFCWAVVFSDRFRELVTAPSRRERYQAPPFVLCAVIASVLVLTTAGIMLGAW